MSNLGLWRRTNGCLPKIDEEHHESEDAKVNQMLPAIGTCNAAVGPLAEHWQCGTVFHATVPYINSLNLISI